MSLVEPAVRSATVRAIDVTEVFRVPHYALSNLLEDDPVVLHLVLVTIIRVLVEAAARHQLARRQRREAVGVAGVVDRLAATSGR